MNAIRFPKGASVEEMVRHLDAQAKLAQSGVRRSAIVPQGGLKKGQLYVLSGRNPAAPAMDNTDPDDEGFYNGPGGWF